MCSFFFLVEKWSIKSMYLYIYIYMKYVAEIHSKASVCSMSSSKVCLLRISKLKGLLFLFVSLLSFSEGGHLYLFLLPCQCGEWLWVPFFFFFFLFQTWDELLNAFETSNLSLRSNELHIRFILTTLPPPGETLLSGAGSLTAEPHRRLMFSYSD